MSAQTKARTRSDARRASEAAAQIAVYDCMTEKQLEAYARAKRAEILAGARNDN